MSGGVKITPAGCGKRWLGRARGRDAPHGGALRVIHSLPRPLFRCAAAGRRSGSTWALSSWPTPPCSSWVSRAVLAAALPPAPRSAACVLVSLLQRHAYRPHSPPSTALPHAPADEPTSGLDSTASKALITALQAVARGGGVTCTAVVHQPSWPCCLLFDDLLLLGKGGRTGACIRGMQAHPGWLVKLRLRLALPKRLLTCCLALPRLLCQSSTGLSPARRRTLRGWALRCHCTKTPQARVRERGMLSVGPCLHRCSPWHTPATQPARLQLTSLSLHIVHCSHRRVPGHLQRRSHAARAGERRQTSGRASLKGSSCSCSPTDLASPCPHLVSAAPAGQHRRPF